MPIFEIAGKRLLFIHVPKTGGTSVTSVLSQQAKPLFDAEIRAGRDRMRPRHAPAEVLTAIYSAGMFDYAFMVVRDPLARMLSQYRYQNRKPGMLHFAKLGGFDTWLRVNLWRAGRDPHLRGNHFLPQTRFHAFEAEVFRIEDEQDRLWQRLGEVTGLSVPSRAPRLNASPKMVLRPSSASLGSIARFYGADYRAYGYDLPDPSGRADPHL